MQLLDRLLVILLKTKVIRIQVMMTRDSETSSDSDASDDMDR